MTRAEADELLANAIRQHAEAYELARDDELLGDFGVIAHWQRVEEDGAARYTMQFHRDTIPGHIARGLFSTALHLLDDDDESD